MMKETSRFEQAAENVFQLMKQTIPANTYFISSTQNDRFKILEVINFEGGCHIPSEVDIPVEDSYCNIVAAHQKPLLIKDSLESPFVNQLEVTSLFNIRSYLGVPIILEDGNVFGTLCALDPKVNALDEAHIPLLEAYANLIANTIELEGIFSQLDLFKKQTKKELNLARRLQSSVISKPIKEEHVIIDYFYSPSSSLSGDLCAWYEIEAGKYGAIILDVMGHGVTSALVGMMICPMLKELIVEDSDPYTVLQSLNDRILDLFKEEEGIQTYVTALYLVVDTNNQTLEYMNAGHPPGAVIGKDTITLLDDGTVPLGILNDFPNKSHKISIDKESSIFIYTDGFTDQIFEPNNSKIICLKEELLVAKGYGGSFLHYFQQKLQAEESFQDDICIVTIDLKNE